MRDYLYCVLVCGGRAYPDRDKVFRVMDTIAMLYGGDIMLMHGAARGADTYAEEWAKDREQIYVGVPAQWSKYGRRAGMKRNAEMPVITQVNAAVVFSGGRGTLNMLSLLRNLDEVPQIYLPDGEFWK